MSAMGETSTSAQPHAEIHQAMVELFDVKTFAPDRVTYQGVSCEWNDRQEQLFGRELATAWLIDRALRGDVDTVTAIVQDISTRNARSGLDVGMNLFHHIGNRSGYNGAIAQKIQSFLGVLIEAAPEGVLTEHDKAWGSGNDGDMTELDVEGTLLSILGEDDRPIYWGAVGLRATKRPLWRVGAQPAVPIVDVSVTSYDEIENLKNVPSSPDADFKYDQELLRLVADMHQAENYQSANIITFLERYKGRQESCVRRLGLLYDKALHHQAMQRLGILKHGSIDAALEFIRLHPPRTDLGGQLIEAFKKRIQPEI